MWLLPKLEWNGIVWQLPLDVDAASALVIALLGDPAISTERLTGVLQASPALQLWVLCQAPGWRQSPPRHLGELAEWLLLAIQNGAFFVEPGEASHESDAARQQSADVKSSSTAMTTQPLASLTALPEMCQESLESGLIRDCPWFPVWLRTSNEGNRELVAEKKTSKQRGSSTHQASQVGTVRKKKTSAKQNESHAIPGADVARLLPRALQQAHRAHRLENEFASTLEREKLAALRELAYGASHEINNPLANIATRAQAMLREETNPERKRKLSTIAAQAFRAHEMISDMMLFAKPPTPRLKPIDLVAVVKSVVQEMLGDADSQKTQLSFDCVIDSRGVLADPTQLGVATKALIRNALEALATGGTVMVSVRELTDEMGNTFAEIVVRDSGPGISAEVRRHLFDPFYSGREAGRGLGFGLAKSWRIAELHGGSLAVESEPGSGATFFFRLPIRE